MSTLAGELNARGFRTNGRSRSPDTSDVHESKGGRFTNWSLRDILENQFYLGKVRHKDEYFDGLHQPLISQELFDEVQRRKQQNRHRKSAVVSRVSKNPHMLTGLLRCDQCDDKLWSQNQGRTAGTYYVVPRKGHDHRCAYAGKSIKGQVIEDQASLIFAYFTLRDDWVDWVIENYLDKSDLAEGLRRREALAQKIDRARDLYLKGDLSKERYDRIKSNADAEIATLYIPEIDDAVKASQLVTDLGALWSAASAGQRNRLLRSVLDAIYVDLGSREIVGLLPKESFMALVLAMEERSGVTITANPDVENVRDGGDGGESAPLLPWYPIAVKFSARSYPKPTIAQLIRDRRKQLGIGQSELAHRVGVSPRTIRAWEWSNNPPKDRKFASLFEVLGVEPPR